jgi:hypothetical protein
MAASRPITRFGQIVRAVFTDEGVYPETWNGSAWEPGGSLKDFLHGRVLSRPELAERGIPFDPDPVDQQIIARRGWRQK